MLFFSLYMHDPGAPRILLGDTHGAEKGVTSFHIGLPSAPAF